MSPVFGRLVQRYEHRHRLGASLNAKASLKPAILLSTSFFSGYDFNLQGRSFWGQLIYFSGIMMKTICIIALALMGVSGHCSVINAAELTPDQAKSIATEAYIFGYPLITMEMTRRVMTNVAEPKATHAPMGQFARLREYPNAEFHDVTAPNADTLYTVAWIDISKEPWVLSLPEANDRYYLFPMLDCWTDVFEVPGKRTTGTGPQTYAITGPGWRGELPTGITQYKSPTSIVWLLGRIYCTGTKEDYAAVHKLQNEISVVPLSSYGQPYTPQPGKVDPSIDMKTPVRDQVNAMDTAAYFNLLATLMKHNPPVEADAPMVKQMASLGIVPGEPFAFDKLSAEIQEALKDVPETAFKKIIGHYDEAGKDINGWLFTTKTGLYGTNYMQRAFITAIGLGANRPQDAVYPTSTNDAKGKVYDGKNNYIMHFPKGHLPPVNGFWSLTMYNDKYFFYGNELNRYTLSARNDLKTNADGSVDLYIQHETPGPQKESNWLPCPDDKFILMLRLYWPSEKTPSILDGTWKPPSVTIAE